MGGRRQLQKARLRRAGLRATAHRRPAADRRRELSDVIELYRSIRLPNGINDPARYRDGVPDLGARRSPSPSGEHDHRGSGDKVLAPSAYGARTRWRSGCGRARSRDRYARRINDYLDGGPTSTPRTCPGPRAAGRVPVPGSRLLQQLLGAVALRCASGGVPARARGLVLARRSTDPPASTRARRRRALVGRAYFPRVGSVTFDHAGDHGPRPVPVHPGGARPAGPRATPSPAACSDQGPREVEAPRHQGAFHYLPLLAAAARGRCRGRTLALAVARWRRRHRGPRPIRGRRLERALRRSAATGPGDRPASLGAPSPPSPAPPASAACATRARLGSPPHDSAARCTGAGRRVDPPAAASRRSRLV